MVTLEDGTSLSVMADPNTCFKITIPTDDESTQLAQAALTLAISLQTYKQNGTKGK